MSRLPRRSKHPRRTRARAGRADRGAADARLRAAGLFRRGAGRIRLDRGVPNDRRARRREYAERTRRAPCGSIAVEAPAATPPESDCFSTREPSPYVEAVADEPTPMSAEGLSSLDEPAPAERRHPLRFMWQMDADGRFSLGSDEFTRLIGARTAAGFGRLVERDRRSFGLDPEGRVAQGGRHPRHLERHHPELAGRWRRPVAGRIVGLADLRPDAEFRRLSRLRRLPRSRRA